MIERAKTTNLLQIGKLSEKRRANSTLNDEEMRKESVVLDSKPRRLVFELTNACNLNCIMCGRNSSKFTPTIFDFAWFDYFESIFDTIEEVTLMGWGEPTMHPKFEDMLRRLHKNGVRKYFCTNGMKLPQLTNTLFETGVEIMAISLDGADAATNNAIRTGGDFDTIIDSLNKIVSIKKSQGLGFPYMNFVFTAMHRNFHQIPDMVELAAKVGLEELKVVYLTAFDENFRQDVLINSQPEVSEVFAKAEERANKLGIKLKLPHIQGEDSAGTAYHKPCFTAWRDFFLGSDGYVRSCMSTPHKLFHIDKYSSFEQAWNSNQLQACRATVNDGDKMNESCKICYQSSCANWNRESSFVQIGEKFSPDWERDNRDKK